jgi:hypothetical protein
LADKAVHHHGPSLLTLLGVLFIGLKLAGYITWSWWLVTLPLWGGAAFVLALLVVLGIIALAAG